MHILKSLFTIFCFLGCVANVSATTDADSLALIADKAPSNVMANLRAGRALYKDRQPQKARTYLNKAGNEAQPWLAMIEFDNYRFETAREMAEAYLESKHIESSKEHIAAEELLNRCEIASTMLDRVERVIIIDSLIVDKKSFFKAFRLSAPTGSFEAPDKLPEGMKSATPTTVYVSEKGDRMMWGANNSKGKIRLVESSHLADGSWEKPHAMGDALGLGADANFPFLMSDGITLYYASNGEGSLGGYDIYITRNDGDKYLNPQNIGMPYNSPYDDYLLAIDDATGVGWWATDRNLIPESLTIYIFIPQELRDNYPVAGTDDLVNRARITSIADTWRKNEDYSKYLDAIKALPMVSTNSHSDDSFELSLPDGRIITNINQFTEPEAQDLMIFYLDTLDEFKAAETQLQEMRKDYADGDKSLSSEILNLEVELEQMRIQLRHMVNDVVKAEIRN